jgi:hypothetical protein
VTPRTRLMAGLLVAFNIPWPLLWWYFSGPNQPRDLGVPALFMLLILCTIGMVVLPMFLGGVLSRRWLLLLTLGAVNVFWGLRWIEVFATSVPGGTAYPAARQSFLLLIAISSVGVGLAYALADRALTRRRRP